VSAQHLKRELDNFTAATRLVINFAKSTVTPLNVAEADFEDMVNTLHCKCGSFPQTYLGLPLSNAKLPVSAFAPLIAKVDRYLAGWKASLLSSVGRVVLINSVLSSLLTYAMGAMLLPPGVCAAIDAKRRAFLWTGLDQTSGTQCLVAWEHVCELKEDGGLGVKRLET
jgi:hypothetical protein